MTVVYSHNAPIMFPASWACEWGQDQYGLWQALEYRGARYVFRWIPPGEFMMGSPDSEKGRFDGEIEHLVILQQGFWLGETLVTQAFYHAVMESNPSHFKKGDPKLLPVDSVSWFDSQSFIASLNKLHADLNCYLPLEPMWEYACRAGTTTAFWFGAEIDLNKANYSGIWDYSLGFDDEALRKTNEIYHYPPNPWGLYDMHGNLWEWCLDQYQKYEDKERIIDPGLEMAIQQRKSDKVTKETGCLLRGGGWRDGGRDCRSACRVRFRAGGAHHDIGLRLALGH